MNGKSKNVVVITYAVITVIFVIAFFVVPFERNASAWSAFAFGCVSLIAGAIITFLSFDKGDSLKSKIYGFPIFRLGYYYTIVQLILSIGFIISAWFVEIPSWVVIISGLLLLGVTVIGVAQLDNVRDIVERQDTRVKANTEMMESLRRDVDSLVRKCTDEKVKKELEKLAEEFKYSDPVSSDKTDEVEKRIGNKISELKQEIEEGKNITEELINCISDLLSERNSICKNNKG